MALEGFLTVSEIKNGLVAINRVEELVSVMKKEKNYAVKNVGEAASEWSILAKTLAATESMGILQHFMQLGGLHFLGQWLHEALLRSNESAVEESTCELLRALEKLPMDEEMSIFSEIMVSVKAFVGHKSSRVQESAKTLLEILDRGKAKECDLIDSKEDVGLHDEVKPLETREDVVSSSLGHSAVNIAPVEAGADKDRVAAIHGNELQHPRSSDCSQSESVAAVEIPVPEKPISYTASSQVDDSEVSHVSSSNGADHNSSPDTHAQHSVMELAVEDHVDVKKSEFCLKKFSTNVDSNTSTVVSNRSDAAVGLGLSNNSRSEVNLKTTDDNDGGFSMTENPKTNFSGEISDVKEFAVDSIMKVQGTEHSATTGENLTEEMKTSEDVEMSRLGSEFVGDDALEVARLVAKEVEREVVHYREPLCSSSSKQNSVGRAVQPGSPDSVNREQDQPMTDPQDEILAEQNTARGVISPNGGEHIINAKNKNKFEGCGDYHDSFQVTDVAQVAAHERKTSSFDLNEESYSQEMDQAKVIVSSITAAPTPKTVEFKLSGAPCRVDGKTRHSESAATGAFYPASLARSPDAEKAFSVEGSSSSKQRQDFLDIDLNVAEGNNATDPVMAKISSGLPSGESSVEVSSKRAKTAMWDLNDMVDIEDRTPSPMSSSSTKQPMMRNLDLNDNPSQYESLGREFDRGASTSQYRVGSSGIQLDSPYVSIMGMKVPISREEATPQPQTRSFLPHGPFSMPTISGINYAQSDGLLRTNYAMAFLPPSPGFGYNDLRMEPFMSHSPAMYGSAAVPYPVDLRETHLGQQIIGTPMAVPPTYSRPPFPMGTSTSPAGFNWIGSSQPNRDLNSGMFMAEVGNRDQATSRQVLLAGDINMMEEQMGSTSQAMTSGMRFKRTQPDNGSETYLGAYRRQQPPWS